ncbi:MAG: hypothetical protein IJ354_01705 [Clostridia bacterium]|nr:hypothetical protein [Clostridia bacterium]
MFVTPAIMFAAGATEVAAEVAAEVVEAAGVAAEVAEGAEAAEGALQTLEAVQLESPFSPFDTELVNKSWLDSNILEMTAPSLQEAAEVQKLTPKQHLDAARKWIVEVNPDRPQHMELIAPEQYNWGCCALQVEQNLLATETNAVSLSDYKFRVPYGQSSETIRSLNSAEDLAKALGRKAVPIETDQVVSVMQKLGPGSHVVAGVTNKHKARADCWVNLFYDGEKIYTLNGHKGFIAEGLLQYPKNEDKWIILL